MSKKLVKGKLFVVSSIIALVVVVIVAIVVVLWQKQGAETQNDNPTTAVSKEESEQEKLDRQVEDARAQELRVLMAGETDKQKKAEYLVELSLIYFNRDNFEAALPVAEEAEGLVKTALTAGLLGDIYFATKQYDQAAKQYGVAMERSEKTEVGSRSAYNEFAILKKKAEDAQ